ncbi:MAG: hypothetical protein U0Y08_13700 [Bacteroidia bacterium]
MHSNFSSRVILCLFILCASLLPAFAQQHDQVKVMAYNLLAYPDQSGVVADTTLRNPYYRTIVQAADPDIMAVEELNTQTGYLGFLNNVMNANGAVYSAATYMFSNDTERGLFYKTSKFQFISNTPIVTDLRDINEFKLVHLLSGDTLRVYVVHLKASSGASFEQQRALEVDSLRKRTNALPAGSNFIVCGDFNLYSSSESAYQKLLQVTPGVQGHFIDMINLTGVWNNSAYAPYHTQSPRIRSFGGGATGGMDDRFDLILYSSAIAQSGGVTVVPNSLVAYGNDGNHYNDSINKQPNTAVSAAVANALHNASDHIPVMMTLDFEYGVSATVDAGLSAFIQPATSCPNGAINLQVRLKNYGATTLDLSATPVTAVLKVTNPGGSVTTLQQNVTSGTLSAGTDQVVTFSTSYNMSTGGTYVFSGYTVVAANDANAANDSLPVANFNVVSVVPAAVSPGGPIQLCNGSSATLTASAGSAWLWSNGAATQAITVTAAGSYVVTVTSSGGCFTTSVPVVVSLSNASGISDTVFYESMGTVTATTTIAAHETANGFLRDDLTMSGNGDVRVTQISSGYAGVSGQANVFITNIVGRNYVISDINTSGRSNLSLSFGVYKSTTAATGADFKVQVSSDGVNYTDLGFTALPSGAAWYYRTATGTIPAVPNLRIRFQNTGTTTQYRVDDVLLMAASNLQITNTGSDTLCGGQTTVLTAPQGTNYLWSTGATTSSISVNSAGVYSVSVDCRASVPDTIYACNSVNLQVHFYVEGLYLGANTLRSRLYENGLSTDPAACDSVVVSLYSPASPYEVIYQHSGVFNTSGNITVPVPQSYIGQSFYIVLSGGSMIQTWSSTPVTITGSNTFFDFGNP